MVQRLIKQHLQMEYIALILLLPAYIRLKKNHAARTYEITVAANDVAQNVEIWLYGDVTGDGQVRMNDYAKVLAAVRGTEPLEGYSALCGDVTGDGAIRINDYAQILAHVRGTSSLWD